MALKIFVAANPCYRNVSKKLVVLSFIAKLLREQRYSKATNIKTMQKR